MYKGIGRRCQFEREHAAYRSILKDNIDGGLTADKIKRDGRRNLILMLNAEPQTKIRIHRTKGIITGKERVVNSRMSNSNLLRSFRSGDLG